MLALRCGPRLLGLLTGPRSAPLLLSTTRSCSDSGARDPNSSSRNPLVYLDVGADGQPLGRVVLEVRLGRGANLDFCVLCIVPGTPGDLGTQFPCLREAAPAWCVPGFFKTVVSVEARGWAGVEEKVKVRSHRVTAHWVDVGSPSPSESQTVPRALRWVSRSRCCPVLTWWLEHGQPTPDPPPRPGYIGGEVPGNAREPNSLHTLRSDTQH